MVVRIVSSRHDVDVLRSPLSQGKQEIEGLQALEYQMARSYVALRQARDHAGFSATLFGRLVNWGGRSLAVYCVFRVISVSHYSHYKLHGVLMMTVVQSIMNILAPPKTAATSYPDIITHFLAYLLSLLPSLKVEPEDTAVLAREISLVLVGVIIMSSVRLILRGVTRVSISLISIRCACTSLMYFVIQLLRVTSRNLGASLMLLTLAQLMVRISALPAIAYDVLTILKGLYLLSTMVQLRSAFPPPPDADADTSNLFSTIPAYEVFGALFDWSFLGAACGTALLRWMGDRVNGADV